MSRIPTAVGSICVVFLLACMGGGDTTVTTPGPDGKDGEKTVENPEPTDGEETWCCEYEGPLGKTQSLIDNPKECEEKFGENKGEFISGPQCAPVCCKYPEDMADLEKGYEFETVSTGNCELRKGTTLELEEGKTCRDPDKKVKPTGTKPVAPGRVPRPISRPATPTPGNRGIVRPGGGRGKKKGGNSGGRVTR